MNISMMLVMFFPPVLPEFRLPGKFSGFQFSFWYFACTQNQL
jgi:hypothetical protein